MTRIQFVITDLDNTLLNNEKKVSLLNHQAIEHLKQSGIYFGLASGRDYQSVFALSKDWSIDTFLDVIIGGNGLQIFQPQKAHLICQNKISNTIALKIYKTFKDSGGYYFARNGANRFQESTDVDLHTDAIKYQEPENIVDLQSYLSTHDVDKVSIFCQPNQMNHMKEIAKSLHGLPISMMQSSSHLLEFMDKDTNKGSALHIACNQLGISIENTMAFGDTTNDYSLIKAAGIGVCMKNGTKDVKQVADHITQYTNNEDGFYHFIQKHILSR